MADVSLFLSFSKLHVPAPNLSLAYTAFYALHMYISKFHRADHNSFLVRIFSIKRPQEGFEPGSSREHLLEFDTHFKLLVHHGRLNMYNYRVPLLFRGNDTQLTHFETEYTRTDFLIEKKLF